MSPFDLNIENNEIEIPYKPMIRIGTPVVDERGVTKGFIIELQEALGNVQTLSGLMPICAKCKKIRDDKGYWNQIEKYIEKHSEAVFSHGLCPVCMEEVYKDKPWYEKWKKENKG